MLYAGKIVLRHVEGDVAAFEVSGWDAMPLMNLNRLTRGRQARLCATSYGDAFRPRVNRHNHG